MRAIIHSRSRIAFLMVGLLAGVSACRGQGPAGQTPTPAAVAAGAEEPPSPAVTAAMRQIEDLSAQVRKAEAAGPGAAARAYAVDLPIARLHLEKAALFVWQA